jgi:hypothetical protein
MEPRAHHLKIAHVTWIMLTVAVPFITRHDTQVDKQLMTNMARNAVSLHWRKYSLICSETSTEHICGCYSKIWIMLLFYVTSQRGNRLCSIYVSRDISHNTIWVWLKNEVTRVDVSRNTSYEHTTFLRGRVLNSIICFPLALQPMLSVLLLCIEVS